LIDRSGGWTVEIVKIDKRLGTEVSDIKGTGGKGDGGDMRESAGAFLDF
jgi:hypothetical protein